MRHQAELELANYLRRHPGETSGLAALSAQLAEDPGDVFVRSNMRGHITTSALVLSHDLTSVLLIHHNVYQRWLQPGGHFEGEGTLLESAIREVLEETGVADVASCGEADCPFDIDSHAIGANAKKQEGAHIHHDYVYLLRATRDVKLVPQLEEVSGAGWLPLSGYAQLSDPRARRMAEKLREQGILASA